MYQARVSQLNFVLNKIIAQHQFFKNPVCIKKCIKAA